MAFHGIKFVIIDVVATCRTVVQKMRTADRNRMTKAMNTSSWTIRLFPTFVPIQKTALEQLSAAPNVDIALPGPSADGSVLLADAKTLRFVPFKEAQAVLVTCLLERCASTTCLLQCMCMIAYDMTLLRYLVSCLQFGAAPGSPSWSGWRAH